MQSNGHRKSTLGESFSDELNGPNIGAVENGNGRDPVNIWFSELYHVRGDTAENREFLLNTLIDEIKAGHAGWQDEETLDFLAYALACDERLWLRLQPETQHWDKNSKQRLADQIKARKPGNSLSTPHDKPIPLRRELPSAEPYPIDALGEILAPMAQALVYVVQAPDAVCGQAVLAAAALAVQGHADVVIDGRISALSEFFLCVAESGERKTTADRYALWPHRQRQQQLVKEYRTAFLTYQNDFDSYRKAREEALRRAKSRETKRVALECLGSPPMAPLEPMLMTEEPTYEGIVKLLLVGQPSIGLFSDEGGRFIGGHGMKREEQLKTIAGLCGLWDGKHIDRVRAGDSAAVLYGRRLSMHLMVQPTVARMVFGNALLLDQGLLSRCLVAWPITTTGTRFYKAFDLTRDKRVQDYNERIQTLLKASMTMAEETRNELAPRSLALHPTAKKHWVQFHDHIEKQLGADGPLTTIRGFASKAAEHAVRLAGTLTLVADIQAEQISDHTMSAGIRLAEFYLEEALRLFESTATDPDLELAEKLLAWANLQVKRVIYMQQIYQRGPNGIRDAKTARRIVGILEEHGWLCRVEGGMEIDDSHRRDVWKVWDESL